MYWRERAACRDSDPDLFFPIGRTGPNAVQVDEAKAVCAGCPVKDTCLEWARNFGPVEGIWGGTTESERGPARVRRRSAVPSRSGDERLLHRKSA